MIYAYILDYGAHFVKVCIKTEENFTYHCVCTSLNVTIRYINYIWKTRRLLYAARKNRKMDRMRKEKMPTERKIIIAPAKWNLWSVSTLVVARMERSRHCADTTVPIRWVPVVVRAYSTLALARLARRNTIVTQRSSEGWEVRQRQTKLLRGRHPSSAAGRAWPASRHEQRASAGPNTMLISSLDWKRLVWFIRIVIRY